MATINVVMQSINANSFSTRPIQLLAIKKDIDQPSVDTYPPIYIISETLPLW